MPTTTLNITEQDRVLLDHVRRYRITTTEAVQKLFYADRTNEAAKSALRRLRRAGYIASADLCESRKYYHLTAKAAKRLYGEPAKSGEPLGEQALPRAYGILAFCCLGSMPRKRLVLGEVRENFPDLIQPGLPSSWYYRDVDGDKVRLGYMLVDHGASAQRIVRKCRPIVQRRFEYPPWRTLIRDDNFLIAIITGAQTKADRIHEGLREADLGVKLRIEVVPDLLNLI